MTGDFLITWKPDKWPYSLLRRLIDTAEVGEKAVENWRFAAHRQVRTGDRVYLFKQGTAPRGIFGVGTVTGPPARNLTSRPNEQAWSVPVTFDRIVDPRRTFLVPENELHKLPAPAHRWNTQASGVKLESEVARAVDQYVYQVSWLSAEESDDERFDPTNIEDARERVRRAIVLRRGQTEFRLRLISAYGGKCAITGCELIDLLEAAHIVPFRGTETNHLQNGLLLRSDMHTLFDCGLVSIDHKSMTVVVAPKVLREQLSQCGRPQNPPA